MGVLDVDADLLAERPGLLLLADKGYVSGELDDYLHARGVELLRPSYRNRAPRLGQALLAPIRQLIESVDDTLKASWTWNCTAGAAGRSDRPRRPAAARPHRRHLAQPRHRPAHHKIPNRLRPLTHSDILI